MRYDHDVLMYADIKTPHTNYLLTKTDYGATIQLNQNVTISDITKTHYTFDRKIADEQRAVSGQSNPQLNVYMEEKWWPGFADFLRQIPTGETINQYLRKPVFSQKFIDDFTEAYPEFQTQGLSGQAVGTAGLVDVWERNWNQHVYIDSLYLSTEPLESASGVASFVTPELTDEEKISLEISQGNYDLPQYDQDLVAKHLGYYNVTGY